MNKRVRRVDEISQESKRRILDAAEALFAEKGYTGTSFVDVAERSGISRGSIPWHFENKEGLLAAVVERLQLRALRDADMSETASFRDVMSVLAHSAESDQLGFMLMTEAMKSGGVVHEHFAEYYRRRRRGMRDFMEAAETDGLPIEDTARTALATVLTAAIVGLNYQYLLDPEDVDLAAAVEALSEMVARAYGWY